MRAMIVFAASMVFNLSADAADYMHSVSLRMSPTPVAGAEWPNCRLPGLLILPPGWMRGDAAAMLLSVPGATIPGETQLTTALLEQGAAVMELTVKGDCQSASVSSLGPGPLARLFGGLNALREKVGVGPVVAIGLGKAGSAVLQAVQENVAKRYLGPDGPRFVAAASLGGERPFAVLPGAPSDSMERWESRASQLCFVFDRVAAEEPGAHIPTDATCLAALLSARPRVDASAEQ